MSFITAEPFGPNPDFKFMGKLAMPKTPSTGKLRRSTAAYYKNLHSTPAGAGFSPLLMISRDICPWLPATEPLTV